MLSLFYQSHYGDRFCLDRNLRDKEAIGNIIYLYIHISIDD